MIKPFSRIAADRRTQFHFIPAIGAYQKSRQRMDKSNFCLPSCRDRLLMFLNSVSKFL